MKKIIENLNDLWDFSIKPVLRHFLNLFWLPKIQFIRGRKFHCLKKNFDFDWYYVIDLLHEKIEHIISEERYEIKHPERTGAYDGIENDIHRQQLALRLMDIINEKDKCYGWDDKTFEQNGKYVNVRNIKRFFYHTEYTKDASSGEVMENENHYLYYTYRNVLKGKGIIPDKWLEEQNDQKFKYDYCYTDIREAKAWHCLWMLLEYNLQKWWT